RPDVASFFKDSIHGYSGLRATFPKRDIEYGKYSLGIELVDTLTGIQHYAISAYEVIFAPDEFSAVSASTSEPQGRDSIVANFDRYEEKDGNLEIEGWAFIAGQPADSVRCHVLLETDTSAYEGTTDRVNRPDVQDYFKTEYRISSAGFKTKIKKGMLPPARYRIGLVIENRKTKV